MALRSLEPIELWDHGFESHSRLFQGMYHFAETGQFSVTGVLSIVIGQEIQQKRGGEEEQELQFLGLKVTFFY
jgi:hypothetical protein